MRAFALVWVTIVLGFIVGWIMNLAAIFQTTDPSLTPIMLIRCVGVVVPPLGGILGWF